MVVTSGCFYSIESSMDLLLKVSRSTGKVAYVFFFFKISTGYKIVAYNVWSSINYKGHKDKDIFFIQNLPFFESVEAAEDSILYPK